MAADKASAHFVVIKYFTCLLSCHGFNALFFLPFPMLPFPVTPTHAQPPAHSPHTCRSHHVSEMSRGTRVLGPATSIFPVPWLPLHPSTPTPPPASTSERFQWLIISTGQCSQLWLSWFASWHCHPLGASYPSITVEASDGTTQNPQPLFSGFNEPSAANVSFW